VFVKEERRSEGGGFGDLEIDRPPDHLRDHADVITGLTGDSVQHVHNLIINMRIVLHIIRVSFPFTLFLPSSELLSSISSKTKVGKCPSNYPSPDLQSLHTLPSRFSNILSQLGQHRRILMSKWYYRLSM
jgi:hypothetical protein